MTPARDVYGLLLAAYGPQSWWPADDLFEIMIGALLVQRTTWTNAAGAIAALKSQQLVSPEALAAADLHRIEECCRSAGFYRSKAARIKLLSIYLTSETSLDAMRRLGTAKLRALLLTINGIGPETADAILLYGFGRPAIVVDAYLRRLYQRLHGHLDQTEDLKLRSWIDSDIRNVGELNELHALVVAHGKGICRTRPRCGGCRLGTICHTGRATSDAQLGDGVGNVAQ